MWPSPRPPRGQSSSAATSGQRLSRSCGPFGLIAAPAVCGHISMSFCTRGALWDTCGPRAAPRNLVEPEGLGAASIRWLLAIPVSLLRTPFPEFHAPRPFTEDPQWQLRPRVSTVSGQLRAGPCASRLLLGRIASLVRLRWAAGTAGVGLRAAAASCLLFCRHRFCVSQSGFGPCTSMSSPLAVSSLAQGQGGFVDTEFDPSVFRSYTLPAALSRVRRPGPSL